MSFFRRYLPWVIHVISALAVLFLSIRYDGQIPDLGGATSIVGLVLIAFGVVAALWAMAHLKLGMLPRIDPALDSLVTSGPYAFVRHPAYLAFAVGITGIALYQQSLFGLIAVAVVFVPSEIWRSSLEERELVKRFGSEYIEYQTRVPFLLPRPRKRAG